MSDRAAWLAQIADECIQSGGSLPLINRPDVTGLFAVAFPEPDGVSDWQPREIRFSAHFRNGDVIVTSRRWSLPR